MSSRRNNDFDAFDANPSGNSSGGEGGDSPSHANNNNHRDNDTNGRDGFDANNANNAANTGAAARSSGGSAGGAGARDYLRSRALYEDHYDWDHDAHSRYHPDARIRSLLSESRATIDHFRSLPYYSSGRDVTHAYQLDQLSRQLAEVSELKDRKAEIWRQKFEVKCREVEYLRSQVPHPGELAVMRSKVLDDAERAFREKLSFFETEATRFKDMYNLLRREHERVKLAMTQQNLSTVVERDDILAKAHQERRAFTERLHEIKTLLGDKLGTDEERINGLERDKADLLLRVKVLQEDLEAAREENEKTNFLKEKMQQTLQNELNEVMARANAYKDENENLNLRLRNGEKELELALQTHGRLHARIVSLEKEASLHKARGDDALAQHADEKSAHLGSLRKLEEAQDARARDQAAFQHELDALQGRIGELQSNYKDSLSRIALSEQEFTLKLAKQREDEANTVSRLELQIAGLERDLRGLQRAAQERDAKRVAEITHLHKLLDNIHKVELEKHALHHSARAALTNTAAALQDLERHRESLMGLSSIAHY